MGGIPDLGGLAGDLLGFFDMAFKKGWLYMFLGILILVGLVLLFQ